MSATRTKHLALGGASPRRKHAPSKHNFKLPWQLAWPRKCAVKDHSAKLVGIADQLGDPPFGLVHRRLVLAFSIVVFWIIGRHNTVSWNCSAICRLLFFTADLICSFRAQHTGTKGEDKTFWRLTE
uniref:Uncharacterized protein n=1 Tax=Solanum tuberosum TaxID=4113 RepID=M1E0Y3_SOLTU